MYKVINSSVSVVQIRTNEKKIQSYTSSKNFFIKNTSLFDIVCRTKRSVLGVYSLVQLTSLCNFQAVLEFFFHSTTWLRRLLRWKKKSLMKQRTAHGQSDSVAERLQVSTVAVSVEGTISRGLFSSKILFKKYF